MNAFLFNLLITTIVWIPGVLAGIGAGHDWNSLIILMLTLGQAGLIATLVVLLHEITKRVPGSRFYREDS